MNKAFLYLCTLISLFITLSGFASVRHASELVLHLLFLPITLYLLTATVSQMKNPRKTVTVSLTGHTMSVAGIFFVLIAIIVLKLVSLFMLHV